MNSNAIIHACIIFMKSIIYGLLIFVPLLTVDTKYYIRIGSIITHIAINNLISFLSLLISHITSLLSVSQPLLILLKLQFYLIKMNCNIDLSQYCNPSLHWTSNRHF